MSQENSTIEAQLPNSMELSIDPLKYISSLPEFNGKGNELFTFLELVDQIIPLVSKYNASSQTILLNKIKSKLVDRAREVVEINSHLKTWSEIKKILIDNFGDKKSALQIFDELRSVTFTSDAVDFYNQITNILRRLNNKIKDEPDSNKITETNIQTGLRIFKDKISEPMRSILFSRNPKTLEEALDILVEGNYAHYNPSRNISFKMKAHETQKTSNTRKPFPSHHNNNKQPNSKFKSNNHNQHHPNTRPSYMPQNSGQFRSNRTQNLRQHQQFNRYNNNIHNNNNMPEPMDVDESINSRIHSLETQNEVENFHSVASENKTYLL